jgi:hypothetical protein
LNLKTRLERLEAKTPTQREPIIINRFYVDPRHRDEELVAYQSNCGLVTRRLPGETVDALMSRCGQLPIESNRRRFNPLFKNELN